MPGEVSAHVTERGKHRVEGRGGVRWWERRGRRQQQRVGCGQLPPILPEGKHGVISGGLAWTGRTPVTPAHLFFLLEGTWALGLAEERIRLLRPFLQTRKGGGVECNATVADKKRGGEKVGRTYRMPSKPAGIALHANVGNLPVKVYRQEPNHDQRMATRAVRDLGTGSVRRGPRWRVGVHPNPPCTSAGHFQQSDRCCCCCFWSSLQGGRPGWATYPPLLPALGRRPAWRRAAWRLCWNAARMQSPPWYRRSARFGSRVPFAQFG